MKRKRLKDKVNLPSEDDVLGIQPENANRYDYYKPTEPEEQTDKRWLTTDGKDPNKRKYSFKLGNIIYKDKPPENDWMV